MALLVPENAALNRFLMQLDWDDRQHILDNYDKEVQQRKAKQEEVKKTKEREKVCE